jgi:hypothetical protein
MEHHPLAEEFVRSITAALVAGHNWLNEGHAEDCPCEFCNEAGHALWQLKILEGILGGSVPFDDDEADADTAIEST